MKSRLLFPFALVAALCAGCVEIPVNQEEEANDVESLNVVPGQVEVEEGQTLQLETVLRPEGVEAKVSWTVLESATSQKGDVYGLLFTSKINGARLFLPQANSSVGGNANYYGNYWTSSVNSSPTGQSYRAHYYTFTNGQRGYMAQYERYVGMTIRPVWDPKL